MVCSRTVYARTSRIAHLPPYERKLSPNYSSRNGARITSVVLHHTQGSYEGTISWFLNPQSKVSSHFVLARSGKLTLMVPLSEKAWHCRHCNAYTIGIECEAMDTDNQKQAITSYQNATLKRLLLYLIQEYQILPKNIMCHRFMPKNQKRTECPGYLFGENTWEAFVSWRERILAPEITWK